MFYIINILFIFVYYFCIYSIFPKQESHKKFAILAGIHLCLFRALANPFNYVDTIGYSTAFENIAKMTFSDAVFSFNYYTKFGQMYVALNWILSRISFNSQILFSFVAILNISIVVYCLYKHTQNILLPLMFFILHPMCYYMSFGVIRQHIAAALLIVAFVNINKNKNISLLFFLLAVFFHTSAFIFGTFYLWNSLFRKIKISKLIFYSLSGVLLFRISLSFVLSYIPRYASLNEEMGNSNNIVPLLFIGGIVLAIFLSGVLKKIFYLGNYTSNAFDILIVKFLFWSVMISAACIGIGGAGRLSIYSYYIMPLAISMFRKYCKSYNSKIIYLGFILYTFSLIFLIWKMSYSGDIELDNFEYSFFWQDKVHDNF